MNDQFEKKVIQVLDQSLEELDAATLSRLKQMKYRALESTKTEHSRNFKWGIVPIAFALLFLVILNLPQNEPSTVLTGDLTDLHILVSPEPLDFYAEDIEFYEWLSEVVEQEPDLFDRRSSVPADVGTIQGRSARTGWGIDGTQPRIDRVPWFVPG